MECDFLFILSIQSQQPASYIYIYSRQSSSAMDVAVVYFQSASLSESQVYSSVFGFFSLSSLDVYKGCH